MPSVKTILVIAAVHIVLDFSIARFAPDSVRKLIYG